MATEQARRKQDDANSAYLKMRSEYRAKLADMVIEIKDDAYVDKPSGLLNGPKLQGGLPVYIPKWDNKPPAGSGLKDTVQLQIDRGTGNFVDLGDKKEFEIPAGSTDFPETFPFLIHIPVSELPENGPCRLRYTFVSYMQDPAIESQITPIICDRMPPYKHDPPKAPAFSGDFLDDTSLPVGGKLTVTIPGYPDWKATDWVFFYLVDSKNIPDDPTTETPIYASLAPSPGTTDSTIQIDADTIRATGDAEVLLTYALRDQALNPSPPALYKKFSLTFGLLPILKGKPRVPQARPGPLSMEHVRDGVSVWIERFDNFKGGDHVRVKWGGKTLDDFAIGTNPMPSIEIPVLPALLMLEDYGKTTSGVKSTNVSYQVVRQGRLFGPEDDDFDVNFETVLPWPDPWPPVDWPDPVHPDLLAGDVKNFDGSRTNELTRADKGEDAKFEFIWYDEAVNGHTLDFYWNGERVVEARTIFDDAEPGHAPGGNFEVTIPWKYIKDGGNGDPIPVHYQLSRSGVINDLFSGTTDVNVNAIAVELPAGSFPSFAAQPVPAYPGCGSLEADGSLRVAIPDLTDVLKAGDKIEVVFTPMRGDDLTQPDNPITPAIFKKTFTLGDAVSPVAGFEFLVQPYTTHILPLYDENAASSRRGRVKIHYTFDDGTEEIASTPQTDRTAFTRPNDPCEIPRP